MQGNNTLKAAILFIIIVLAVTGVLAQNETAAVPEGELQMAMKSPDQLVHEVVNNELKGQDDGRYMYRDYRQTPSGSTTKKMIETKGGIVARLIAINGKPLTPEQKLAENQRLQDLIDHPEKMVAKKKAQQQDADRVTKMFAQLPEAFIYTFDGAEQGKYGPVIHLKFKPKPAYNPPSREMAVFKGMDGSLWIDAKAKRLAKIEATLFREVTFGWGLLGHLDQGGHFFVSQSNVGGDRWEPTYMNIQFTGKVLFFKTINMKQIETATDYKRVPDNLTVAEGVEYLNKEGAQVADAEQHK
jgi:hypothetical protein